MAAVDVERLQFVDVRQSKVGNFMEPANLDRFLNSEVGKAQEKMMREQMAAQMNADVSDPSRRTKPEDIDVRNVRRALFSEQASQDQGYRSPDISTAQLMKSHGPAWYESLANSITSWARSSKETVESGARSGAEAAVTHVRNEGQTGVAAQALSGREAQIDNAVNDALGIKPGGR
ncbi:MAG: hypothetical protein KJ017_10035 [Alphaproteobacteria bacterium]|nr:hypothetical protein [Alphaproteobacteria bacterium]